MKYVLIGLLRAYRALISPLYGQVCRYHPSCSAYALDAVDPDETRAIDAHLAGCARPHGEARALIAAGDLVPAALEPVAPSSALRDRLMATVAATPQEHRPMVARPSSAEVPAAPAAPRS